MQRLKRWESPRREGRNDKGRGGSARQRQKRKQFKQLKQKLTNNFNSTNLVEGRVQNASLCFFASLFG
jgi:hypothetical protein